MKSIVTTVVAVAMVAGCAELPESLKHPFAASAGSTQTDTPDAAAKQTSPYPYNSPLP